jgi:hypothetical protein
MATSSIRDLAWNYHASKTIRRRGRYVPLAVRPALAPWPDRARELLWCLGETVLLAARREVGEELVVIGRRP